MFAPCLMFLLSRFVCSVSSSRVSSCVRAAARWHLSHVSTILRLMSCLWLALPLSVVGAATLNFRNAHCWYPCSLRLFKPSFETNCSAHEKASVGVLSRVIVLCRFEILTDASRNIHRLQAYGWVKRSGATFQEECNVSRLVG